MPVNKKDIQNQEPHKDRPRIKPPEIRPRPAANALPPRPNARPQNRPEKTSVPGARPRSRGGNRADRFPRHGDRPGSLPATELSKFSKTQSARMPGENTTALDAVRLVPLGGLEEIGRNCSFIEYKNEIVIIDAGLQFPEEETPGIDYIIPNTEYLEKKKQNIRAILLTHGHYDHIGALPHMVQKLGNPVIYATSITKAIVERRQEDFPNSPKLNIITVKNGDEMKISNNIDAYFFGVPHTIPETSGIVLKTPIGNIVHFADFRVDYSEDDEPQGLEEFEKVARMGVHTFMVDSTGAEKSGHSISEKTVEKNLEEIFRKAEGRIIVATFASLLTRIAEIMKIADKLGRKVALNGFSMKTNIQIAEQLGFIKTKEGLIIPIEEVNKMRDDKILILSTGAQGESNAGLMKMINGEHRHIKIKPGDSMILSSSVIPGNERSVQSVKDNLARQGALVYTSSLVDIHSSGHAPKEDLKLVMKILKPKFLMPVHGYYFMRAANGLSAREVGIPKENVMLMDNGQVAELTKDAFMITNEKVPAYYVMVDGLGVGDVEELVVRDRRALAQEGMIVIITVFDRDNGKLLKNPDIISRGFIHLKENQDVIEETRKRIRGLLTRLPSYRELEPDYIKTLIRDQIGQFLYTKTRRRPMILPVIIEI
jgi:ribonuclease J